MKVFVLSATLFAALGLAQDLSALNNLPQCGKTCITNMLGQAQQLGCASNNITCLCSNVDFGYGIRDCSNESCGNTADAASVISTGQAFCAANAGNPSVSVSGSTSGATGSATASGASGSGSVTSGSATGSAGGAGGLVPITTSPIVSTITSGGSTIMTTIGSTTIFSSGAAANATSGAGGAGSSASSAASGATASASSAASGAGASASSAISSAGASASSVASSVSAAAGGSSSSGSSGGGASSSSSSGIAYPMATANSLAGAAGIAAMLLL